MLQGLVDNAVALGQADEGRHLLVAGVGIQVKMQVYALKPYGDIRADAQRAAKVQQPLRADNAAAHLNADGRRDRR